MKKSEWLDVFVGSVNYIIISYALSNTAMVLKENPAFILFFASELWVMDIYRRRTYALTKSRIFTAVLFAACFAVHVGMVYFMGRMVGEIVPF